MVTLAQIRNAIGGKINTDMDEVFAQWTEQLTAECEQYCNQPLVSKSVVIERSVDYQTIYDYAPRRVVTSDPFSQNPALYSDAAATSARLLIPLPFVAVPVTLTTAEYRTSVFDSYVSASDVSVVTVDGARFLSRQTGFAGKGWRFTLSAGWSVTRDASGHITASSVPADVQKALITLIQYQYKLDSRGKNILGVSSVVESSQGASTSITYQGVWADVKKTLNNYQVQVI